MSILEEMERHKKLRSITANRTDNIYELTRMRIVRVMRESVFNFSL